MLQAKKRAYQILTPKGMTMSELKMTLKNNYEPVNHAVRDRTKGMTCHVFSVSTSVNSI